MNSLVVLKDDVVHGLFVTKTAEPGGSDNEEFCDSSQADDVVLNTSKDQTNIIEQKFAALLLKLENIFHVPSASIDELLEELQYLLSAASLCGTIM